MEDLTALIADGATWRWFAGRLAALSAAAMFRLVTETGEAVDRDGPPTFDNAADEVDFFTAWNGLPAGALGPLTTPDDEQLEV